MVKLPPCLLLRPSILMDGGKQSSFLINAVNQVNVNSAPDCMCLLMTVVWQRPAGKHCISSSWPETVRRSFTPNKKCNKAGISHRRAVVSESWYISVNHWWLQNQAETWRSLVYPSSRSFYFTQMAQGQVQMCTNLHGNELSTKSFWCHFICSTVKCYLFFLLSFTCALITFHKRTLKQLVHNLEEYPKASTCSLQSGCLGCWWWMFSPSVCDYIRFPSCLVKKPRGQLSYQRWAWRQM